MLVGEQNNTSIRTHQNMAKITEEREENNNDRWTQNRIHSDEVKPVGGDTAMALGAAAAGGPESTGDLLNFIMYRKSLKTKLQVSGN